MNFYKISDKFICIEQKQRAQPNSSNLAFGHYANEVTIRVRTLLIFLILQ